MTAHSTSMKTPPMAKGGFLVRALNWIAAKDYRHRQQERVKNLPNEALRDVGMTRKQANAAFYKRMESRAADRKPMIISARMSH